ncbi:hypothetical protein [Streptomyces bungoensis]|uniref:hypothetical protein n=1 Tax=Streptomyces bungoensis TaxID=285568 RepID=UPI00131B5E6A|nr:hypothetical protein [Streptomyces bungoensis]
MVKGRRPRARPGGPLRVGAMGLLAVCPPGLMTYDARTGEHAVRLRARRAAAASARV